MYVAQNVHFNIGYMIGNAVNGTRSLLLNVVCLTNVSPSTDKRNVRISTQFKAPVFEPRHTKIELRNFTNIVRHVVVSNLEISTS